MAQPRTTKRTADTTEMTEEPPRKTKHISSDTAEKNCSFKIEQSAKECNVKYGYSTIQYNIRWLAAIDDSNYNSTFLEAMCELLGRIYNDGEDEDMIGVEIDPINQHLPILRIPYGPQEELSMYEVIKAIAKDGGESGYLHNDDLRIVITRATPYRRQ